jgi:putative endonuclease
MGRGRKVLGSEGETAAAGWLEARGYQILARNVRTRAGEIDLVADQDGLVVFVEVKSRTSARFGHPGEAVVARKQRRLTRLAAAFLQAHNLLRRSVRFDVIAVHCDPTGRVREIEHVPDAFSLEGPGARGPGRCGGG